MLLNLKFFKMRVFQNVLEHFNIFEIFPESSRKFQHFSRIFQDFDVLLHVEVNEKMVCFSEICIYLLQNLPHY